MLRLGNRVILPAVLSVLLLPLAACGGSDEPGAKASETPSAAESMAVPEGFEAAASAEERKVAEGALLTLEDFPKGWQVDSEAAPKLSEERDGRILLSQCAGREVDALFDPSVARAVSPIYAGQSAYVNVEVTVARDVARAEKDFATLTGKKYADCLAEFDAGAVRDGLAGVDGATVGKMRSEVFPETEGLGDEQSGLLFTIPYRLKGESKDLEVVYLTVRSGRAIAQVYIKRYPGSDWSGESFKSVLKTLRTRLRDIPAEAG